MEPESRSSSPYLLSLKWKPASFPNWMSRLTIISMLTFGAWWPRSTSDSACGSELRGAPEARPPVVQHGRVERGFLELVLQEHAPAVRQAAVDRAQAVEVALERATEMLLAGEVPAVADPDRDASRSRAPGRSRCTRGCARPPARARPRPDGRGCRTCTSAPGRPDPGTCSSSWRRRRARVRPRGPSGRARRRGGPTGCAARPRASRAPATARSRSRRSSRTRPAARRARGSARSACRRCRGPTTAARPAATARASPAPRCRRRAGGAGARGARSPRPGRPAGRGRGRR